MVTDIQRNDLLLLYLQLQCDAVRQIDRDGMNTLKSPRQCV